MDLEDFKKRISRINDLPTLPTTVLRITELINNPKSSARDIASVITEDQVLTARLLKLVNSPFYGFPQRISTVTSAIVLLGFDAIRNLLLTTSIFDLFSTRNKGTRKELEGLWKHALGCAVAAKTIGSFIKYDKLEELFVAGLLHDIGKIVEAILFPDDFFRVCSLVREKDMLMVEAEEILLEFTHAEIGAALGERWNIPPKLVSVIANHHKKELPGEYTREISVIHLSDIFARALDLGSGGDTRVPMLNKDAWKILEIDMGAIEGIMKRVDEDFKALSASVIP